MFEKWLFEPRPGGERARLSVVLGIVIVILILVFIPSGVRSTFNYDLIVPMTGVGVIANGLAGLLLRPSQKFLRAELRVVSAGLIISAAIIAAGGFLDTSFVAPMYVVLFRLMYIFFGLLYISLLLRVLYADRPRLKQAFWIVSLCLRIASFGLGVLYFISIL